MSQTLDQIFIANPSTTMLATDLVYLVHSPFTPGTDSAITWANMQAAITAVGTIAAGIWQGTLIGATYGGTGINNGSKTITLGGSLITSGAFASTFTMTAATNVTFPTSGTLATTTGTVTTATNLAGGTANDIPYQTGVGVTSFVTETANGVLTYSSGGVPTSSTTLPATVQTNITALGTLSGFTTLAAPGSALANGFVFSGTSAGEFVMQAGIGSAAAGGGLVMFGSTHPTKAGWFTAGLSSQAGSQFTINNSGWVGSGSDVFVITNAGVVTTGTWNGTTIAVANGGTGITSFGTGVATALGQNVNGSGAISLTTSPTLVTPALGVIASGDLSAGTGSLVNITTITTSADSLIHGLTVGLGKNSVATNTAVGNGALVGASLSGNHNTGIGLSAGASLSSGTDNTFIGYQAGLACASGVVNTMIGSGAGTAVTSSNNVIIGQGSASTLTTGGANTLIGTATNVSSAACAAAIAIGYGAVAPAGTGATSGTDSPGIAIGSVSNVVGVRGDGSLYPTAGIGGGTLPLTFSGYWRVKINGTFYKIPLYPDA